MLDTYDKALVYIVIGGAWGDEGKGKVATYYSKNADLTIRATGGANAGHTVYFDGEKVALHLIPGGIGYEKTICLIGQGVALDLEVLFQEMKALSEMGVPNVRNRLFISGMATVVMPYHKELDKLKEKMRDNKVGTTGRGIGPAYTDKVSRDGLVVWHLLDKVENLEKVIANAVKSHNILFRECGMEEVVVDPHELAVKYHEYGESIRDMVVEGHPFVRKFVNDQNKTIVVEGAQAVMLSIEVGDRPTYVTSSDSNINGTLSGAHLNWNEPTEVVMTLKGYFSRVGNGPFYGELPAHIGDDGTLIPFEADEAYVGDLLRDKAGEYGATTGRPRRVGDFDAVVAKYAAEVSGATYLCINHIDTIGEFGLERGSVQIIVSYEYMGEVIDYYPFDTIATHEIPKPHTRITMPGWKVEKETTDYEDLPVSAREYIEEIEKLVGVPVKYIGIGPKNEDMIVRWNV